MSEDSASAARRQATGALEQAIRPARNRSLGDEVYDALARLIGSGELGSGSRLPSEGELCRLFAVSRPVVRKALTQLREDGMIVSRKGAGSFVSARAAGGPRGLEDPEKQLGTMLQALEFRCSIEPDAAYYAAIRRGPRELAGIAAALDDFDRLEHEPARRRVDMAFHRSIAEAARNDHYARALDVIDYDIEIGITLARHLSQLGQEERRTAIFAEHRAIYLGIEAQDPAAAREAMLRHLEYSRVRVTARGEEILRRVRGGD
ncbi:FadR/GntR family transcriptional regulator [Paralimibaculum aggregatum]|uniref:FadR/GntR family transcriptional regulator n=1 Tax=Paralimibaculum aggregatum TaxID=3036245 RepID=A0ABQ6LRX6_9RHOB|nr:FadR/GntR family transcriptional regulator [Limibaculum sp. NKW23]GMG84276.1 FadR/GntR family transcriptional regulator [Limibaculum sp. NKW23]